MELKNQEDTSLVFSQDETDTPQQPRDSNSLQQMNVKFPTLTLSKDSD
jgi:hypothetical protein